MQNNSRCAFIYSYICIICLSKIVYSTEYSLKNVHSHDFIDRMRKDGKMLLSPIVKQNQMIMGVLRCFDITFKKMLWMAFKIEMWSIRPVTGC